MSFVDDLRQSHENILQSIKGLKEDELNRPGTMGEWSIRDALLHITMWDAEVLKMLAIWHAGQKVDWSYIKDHETILKFNDFWITNLKHLSVETILEMLDSIHAAIIADIASIPENELKKRKGIPGWVREITVEHHREHIEKIKAYRAS
jgi:hypothetical protein